KDEAGSRGAGMERSETVETDALSDGSLDRRLDIDRWLRQGRDMQPAARPDRLKQAADLAREQVEEEIVTLLVLDASAPQRVTEATILQQLARRRLRQGRSLAVGQPFCAQQ